LRENSSNSSSKDRMISVVRGMTRDVVAVEQAPIAVEVGEDRLSDLQRTLLRLDQR
jgi:hypothetical protein